MSFVHGSKWNNGKNKTMMLSLLILLILTHIVKSGFYANRIMPGKFEYSQLNGHLLVNEARAKCDEDAACGGFTFKGSFKSKHIPMEVYFFHLVPNSNKVTIPSSIIEFDSITKVSTRYLFSAL